MEGAREVRARRAGGPGRAPWEDDIGSLPLHEAIRDAFKGQFYF